MHVTAIIAAGGAGRRLGAGMPKQLIELGGRSMLRRCVETFVGHPRVADVVVVLPADLAAEPPEWLAQPVPHVRVVRGGERRQDSVANGFDALPESCDVVLVHDAARPFVSAAVITRAIDAAAEHGAAIAAVPVSDTVKRVVLEPDSPRIVETIPRETVYLAQTPQAFRREVLGDAVRIGRAGADATDEAALAERAGHVVRVVEGDPDNWKVTTARDLDAAMARTRRGGQVRAAGRVGVGYDLHRLVERRPLVLGGVTVPSDRGALGHSDADVVCHAATDAILGAACLGDIGRHFPDTSPEWKDASSLDLLGRAAMMVRQEGLGIRNLDVTVLLERPKIATFLARIREGVADSLGIPVTCVSVKGKTNEGVDAIGRGEAIAAHAVALLEPTED
jgi:2-C-methyl-D-erythritol 4-phosphate cytidylyltransferase/2-C-methyl-D-erythritol 2,4-cyclodiphosphate synthase